LQTFLANEPAGALAKASATAINFNEGMGEKTK